jgi:AcrR family transcriptional regulator
LTHGWFGGRSQLQKLNEDSSSIVSVRERKERERIARRETILAAAAQVFAAQGVERATVEMVARQAEVAVGTIYLYFFSRDDLFLSLMAERIGKLRERYLEIHARGLKPIDELRAIGNAYFDYLRESRGLFLAQLSVTFSKLTLRLSRAEELEHFEQVRRLSRECFDLYRDSVRRMLAAAGARSSSTEATRAATVIWAAISGAFLLMGDEEIFRDVTGLESARLLEETFEFQIAAAQAAAKVAVARPLRSNAGATKSVQPPARGRRVVKTSRGIFASPHDGAVDSPKPARWGVSPPND